MLDLAVQHIKGLQTQVQVCKSTLACSVYNIIFLYTCITPNKKVLQMTTVFLKIIVFLDMVYNC